MVTQKIAGEIDGMDVTVTIEGDDEGLANLIYADVVGHVDTIKQMVEHDVPIEGTEPPMSANWADSEYAESVEEVEADESD
jgi:hypothetical protein